MLNGTSENSNCVYCEYNALVDSLFCFFATGSFIRGLDIVVVALVVIWYWQNAVSVLLFVAVDAERARWSVMPERWVCAWEVTRVQRASDWAGFVNVTTLPCQKEHCHNSGHLLSHSSLTPFPLSSIPDQRRHHLSSPVITKKRPHESQHSSHPLGDPSENNTSLALLTRRIQDAALYIQLPDMPPSQFTPTSISVPRAHFSHSAGRNRTADCRAWAPCISAPNPPAHDTLDRPGAIPITRAAATGQRSTPPCLVLAYLTCDRARSVYDQIIPSPSSPCRRRVLAARSSRRSVPRQAADVYLPAQQPPLTRHPQAGDGRVASLPRRLLCHRRCCSVCESGSQLASHTVKWERERDGSAQRPGNAHARRR